VGPNRRPLSTILLVEDSEDDELFFRHAVKRSGLHFHVYCLHNGDEAIDCLKGKSPYNDRRAYPFPDIIVTDLKMPKSNGFDLLRWLQDHPECAIIPTIVLSSSFIDGDVREAYHLGANAFAAKPGSIAELADLLTIAVQFWSRCLRPDPPPTLKCE
jgi:CheY-like chemotaxis protein